MDPFVDYEFHRAGIGRAPAAGRGQGDSPIHIPAVGGGKPLRSCTCTTSRRKTCDHLKELSRKVRAFEEHFGRAGWGRCFEKSVWHLLAQVLHEGLAVAVQATRVARLEAEDGSSALVFTSPRGDELARYLEAGPARVRLLERLGKAGDELSDRAGVIERLARFQATPEERQLNKRGMVTRRQSWEESFWYRLAYHACREWGLEAWRFHPSIDRETGDFRLSAHVDGEEGEGEEFLRLIVPRKRVAAALDLLAKTFPEQKDLAISPVPLRSVFRITQDTELDLEIRDEIQALQASGEGRFFAREELEKFRYGRLVYVPELEILAELEKPGKERRFQTPKKMRLERSQIPSFLEEHRGAFEAGALVLDEPLRGLEILREVDYLELAGDALERSWFELSARYGVGESEVSLRDLLEAHSQNRQYLETEHGWVDLRAPAFRGLEALVGLPTTEDEETLRLSAGQILRLSSLATGELRYRKSGGEAALRQLLELRPATPFEPPEGLRSELRDYQRLGVDWLRFLWQNGLGGLLADDMGLGKTHQAMALMVCLREQEAVGAPFLVVCPTSVLPHWRDKLRDFAPGLTVAVHHGLDRDLSKALEEADVLVTSYGVLRRDVAELSAARFALVVFDEIQYLKNRDTQGWAAARDLAAEVKLGLTGTPIENSLVELKALFDLVLPGYLGSEEAFNERYAAAEEAPDAGDDRLEELRRVSSPFVLRRTKAAVLDELPERIEDVRTCELSDDQVKLYREAISERGGELLEALRGEGQRLPYIHVFALLNLLKQICDHPALAMGALESAGDYTSGKWDLYRELLAECLESGQKVVVFSQYLGMLELMSRHLEGEGVGYAKLTGSSRNRGEIVDRFNGDPECRVFLGSLKAGGTGIDLVGGSVVIHYDRWWNAAREDQASDRVHRIGQKRAVQIFKLITEGTLEEKIAAIIAKKRQLMTSVITADDPKLSKIFTREELLDLLALPG